MYHATLKVFTRAQGHTATGAAAYRAGLRILDERTGTAHDYTRRKGVVSVLTLSPDDAPEWAADPSAVWNAAERAEGRRNSCVARELEVALPSELNPDQREALARDLGLMLVERYNVAVLVAVHEPSETGDDRNHHAHILFSTRVLGPEGFGAKTTVLDKRETGKDEVRHLRAEVARLTNQHLAAAGVVCRVDHRSLRDQATSAARRGDTLAVARLSRTPQLHRGKSATALERRGQRTERGGENAAIRRDNTAVARSARAGRIGVDRSRVPSASVRRPGPAQVIGDASFNTRATGASARLLNAQATAEQERLRIERDRLRAYVRMIQEVAAEGEAQANAVVRRAQAEADRAESERLAALHARTRPTEHETVPMLDSSRRSGRKRGRRPDVEPAGRSEPMHSEENPRSLSKRQWAEKRRRERRVQTVDDNSIPSATKRPRPG
ncbi:MobQ family relaxase [Tahibacter aquaticus]|uniref:MobQ family relaxase n=1 Tax=Tahibacter aquaticus TaxID=520092 RepID=UPI0024426330|nr:MobQ family relaxase [Tahibacter aquaticus]